MSLSPGTRLGVYEILGPLGSGGMGQVYRAKDTQLGREVAIKVLYAEAAQNEKRLRRLVAEARAASALNHPNILTVFGMGEEQGFPYIVTELVEGKTVAELITRGDLDPARAIDLALQALAGLAKAHDAGIVHRDLKPENLIVSQDGFVKILDFGLAKLFQKDSDDPDGSPVVSLGLSATEQGTIVGTAGYMSPEQVRGEAVSAPSDLFSMGIILYEMLTGRNPFRRDNAMDTLTAVLRDPPPPLQEALPAAPARLSAAVERALCKRAADRFASAREMEWELRGVRADVSSGEGSPYRGPGVAGSPTERSSAPTVRQRPPRVRRATAVAIGALVVAAGTATFLWSRGAATPPGSLAVLPFSLAGSAAESDYLGDGIAETLIDNLSQLPGLHVVPRTASFRYRGREGDLKSVGRALGVGAVMTGRVTVRDPAIIVQAELVDSRSGAQVWGHRYETDLTRLLTVQEEIAGEVIDKLRRKATARDKKLLSRRDTQDNEAYQSYLKGRYSWNRMSEDGITKAIGHFNKAIERDPNYALAHAGLADSYFMLGRFGRLLPRDTAPRAAASARRALEIDSNLPEAHTALGTVALFYDWNWPEAEKEFRRAIALNPDYAEAHRGLGHFFLVGGRFDEARRSLRRAADLDPLSLILSTELGIPDLYSGQYDAAIAQFQKTVELDPTFWHAHLLKGVAYFLKRVPDRSIAEFQTALRLAENQPLEVLIHAYGEAVAGRTDRALQLVQQVEVPVGGRQVDPVSAAVAYTFLGKKDDALRWLEKGYQQRGFEMVYLKVEPAFVTFHDDPRFADLARRIGLP